MQYYNPPPFMRNLIYCQPFMPAGNSFWVVSIRHFCQIPSYFQMQEYKVSQCQTRSIDSFRTKWEIELLYKWLVQILQKASTDLFHSLKGTALTLYERERRLHNHRQQ